MFKKRSVTFALLVCAALAGCSISMNTEAANDATASAQQEFPASSGGKLHLDLKAGASVDIRGSDRSSISVSYNLSCLPKCKIDFRETADGLKITTRQTGFSFFSYTRISLVIEVPRQFDVELDSWGGPLAIAAVEGRFSGETMGGALSLHGVRGNVKLKTMGGRVTVVDSEIAGSLTTMGGAIKVKNSMIDGSIKTLGGPITLADSTLDGSVMTYGGPITATDSKLNCTLTTKDGQVRFENVSGDINTTSN